MSVTKDPLIVWSQMDSPVGRITVAMTKQGVCFINYSENQEPDLALRIWMKKNVPMAQLEREDQPLLPVTHQIESYFQKKRKQFTFPYDLVGTAFQKRVWQELTRIPYGETRSYKQIAEAIGRPKAVRAVGGANHRNPLSIVVPCHRVIGSNGALVGYGGGLKIKEKLLALEKEAI